MLPGRTVALRHRHTSPLCPAREHGEPDTSRWLESLSPWPEEFGLERMRALLAALGEPQRAFPAIHVVGTNGKTSTTLMCAALLHATGLRVGAYVSPHVRGWAERIQVDGATPTSSARSRASARTRPGRRSSRC